MTIDIPDFVKVTSADPSMITKYRDLVPPEMVYLWENYGMGTLVNGFLKTVNPDDYFELLTDISGDRWDGIPLFVTGMGDIIAWYSEDYESPYYGGPLNCLMFTCCRKGYRKLIASSMKFFFVDIYDEFSQNEELSWQPYPEAVERYGELAYDQCFGYVPILGVGGPEKIDNLDKVKIREHIWIHLQFLGPIVEPD